MNVSYSSAARHATDAGREVEDEMNELHRLAKDVTNELRHLDDVLFAGQLDGDEASHARLMADLRGLRFTLDGFISACKRVS
jgi:hypothetical protein